MRKFLIILLHICCVTVNGQTVFATMAESAAKDGNYEEAVRLRKLSLNSCRMRNDRFNLFMDLCDLSDYFAKLGERDSCEFYADKTLEYWPNVKEDGIEYNAVLSHLSYPLKECGNCQRAQEYRKQILDNYIQRYGYESHEVVNQLRIVASFAKDCGDYDKAIEYAKKEELLNFALIDKPTSLSDKISYSETFSWLRYVLQDCDSLERSIPYLLDVLKRANKNHAITYEDYEHTLNTLSAICRDNNYSIGSIAIYKEEALNADIRRSFDGIVGLCSEDANIGNDPNAPLYGERVYNLCLNDSICNYFEEKEVGDVYYVMSLYYSKLIDWERYFQMAKLNYEFRVNHGMDIYYHDIGVVIAGANRKDHAEYAAKVGVKSFEDGIYANDAHEEHILLEFISSAYITQGDFDNAFKYYDILANKHGGVEVDYSYANLLLLSQKFDKLKDVALRLYESSELTDEQRWNVLRWYLCAARNERDGKTLVQLSDEFVNLLRAQLTERFAIMSEDEQDLFVSQNSELNTLMYDFFIGLGAKGFDWSNTAAAYDYTLMYKGLLLTNHIDSRNIIKSSNDIKIKEKWQKLQSLKNDGIFRQWRKNYLSVN